MGRDTPDGHPHDERERDDRYHEDVKQRSAEQSQPAPSCAADDNEHQREDQTDQQARRDGQQRKGPRGGDRTFPRHRAHQANRGEHRAENSSDPCLENAALLPLQPRHALDLGLLLGDALGGTKHHFIHRDSPAAFDADKLPREQMTARAGAVVALIAVRATEAHRVDDELKLAGQERRPALRALPGLEVPERVIAGFAVHGRGSGRSQRSELRGPRSVARSSE